VNRDVNLTTIRFSVDGVVAVANFPVTTPGVPGSATLTIDNTQLPLTLQATTSPPTGYAYACLGDSSTDAGVDGLPVRPADGPPVCRAPSPDYGPTSVFSVPPQRYTGGNHGLPRGLRRLGVAGARLSQYRHGPAVRIL
jgi:hypothetical protein